MATTTTTKRPAKAPARKSTRAAKATPSKSAAPTGMPKGCGSEQFEYLLAKAEAAAAAAEAAANEGTQDKAGSLLDVAAAYHSLAIASLCPQRDGVAGFQALIGAAASLPRG